MLIDANCDATAIRHEKEAPEVTEQSRELLCSLGAEESLGEGGDETDLDEQPDHRF